MNEFTKENRGVPSEILLKSYHSCIVSIDALIQRIKADKEVSISNKKELALLISNYSSCVKTVICRYLKASGYSNQRINNFSTTEVFFKFKKEIAKDNKATCNLSHELHLVVFNLRNKLSHTLNQVDYVSLIVEKSGMVKILGLLNRLSIESKEIETQFEKKLENLAKEELANEKTIPKERYPFGIVC